MNNPFKAAKNFINRYKKEEWFRAVVIIIIVTVLTVFGVGYKRYRAEKEWTIVNKVDKQNDKIYRKFISA